MAIFRCLQSGNTIEFTQPHDIDSMKGHSGYVRVEEVEPEPVKRVGRPRRVAETIDAEPGDPDES